MCAKQLCYNFKKLSSAKMITFKLYLRIMVLQSYCPNNGLQYLWPSKWAHYTNTQVSHNYIDITTTENFITMEIHMNLISLQQHRQKLTGLFSNSINHCYWHLLNTMVHVLGFTNPISAAYYLPTHIDNLNSQKCGHVLFWAFSTKLQILTKLYRFGSLFKWSSIASLL